MKQYDLRVKTKGGKTKKLIGPLSKIKTVGWYFKQEVAEIEKGKVLYIEVRRAE